MNKDIMIAAGFGKEVDLVEHKRCPTCGNNIGGVHPHNPKENRYPLDIAGSYGYGPFHDALSYREYGISGMWENTPHSLMGAARCLSVCCAKNIWKMQ
jgi:hypothetical protein